MSTKTTIKRIALVAVSALGFGVLAAVAPASASVVTAEATPCYVSTAEYGALASGETATATMTATQIAGAANYVEVTCGTDTTSGSTAVVAVTGSTVGTFAGSTATWTVATGAASATSNSNDISSATFRVATAAAGTVTVTISKRVIAAGAATDTKLQTITITVNEKATKNVYSAANSTVLATSDSAANPSTTSDAAVIATPVAIAFDADNTVEALKIVVDQEDVNDVNLSTAVANAVTVSGVGRVGLDVNTPLGQYATETDNDSDFYIFADGRAGQGTVTVSVNGAVVKTYVVNFYGKVASLTATTKVTHIAPGATTSGVVEVVAKDAAGVIVPGVTITGTASSTTAITAVTAAGDGDNDGDQLVGFTTASTAAGAYTVSFKDGQSTPIVSNTVTFTVAKTTAKTVTLTTDKATYLPGEKVTITVTANDSNGNGIADGSYALFAATVASSTALQGELPTATVALVSGKKTFTVYAPLTSGTVTLTATEGSATDSTTKGTVTGSFTVGKTAAETAAEAAIAAAEAATAAAKAAQDAAVAAAEKAGKDAVAAAKAAQDASVAAAEKAAKDAVAAAKAAQDAAVAEAQASADAAAEAIDAANAATDAANLAAEAADAATVAAEEARDAADAATAAVEELATQVATLMAALKAQITTLANTVAKIAKKVRA